jgi:hypothetical protein
MRRRQGIVINGELVEEEPAPAPKQ